MRKAVLVYNPLAGRYPSWMLTERAADVLRKHNWQVYLEQTQSGEHVTQLARQAAHEEFDAFFVVGGDGSINHALPGLFRTRTALGVLPAGTANVWAQELGLPGLSWTRWDALEESARRLARGEFRQVDVGLCNNQPFLLWAGVGLDAFIVHRLEPRSRLEKHFAVVQYAASILWNAPEWRGLRLRVEANGRTISGHFILGVVSNIHLYAGGLTAISPHARLDDGIMDLWLFMGKSLSDTVYLAWELLSGRHTESDQVMRIPFRIAHLQSDSPMYVQVDGEPIDVPGGTTIQVEQQALRVLVPERASDDLFGDERRSPPLEVDGMENLSNL